MSFDIGRLNLSSGEAKRIDVLVALEPLEFGGQRYTPDPARADATLDVARTTGSGHSLRLRFATTLEGPCIRCLEDAREEMAIDSREIDQPGGGDDLRSPYVDGDELAVEDWARDALVLALPTQIVCREDCLGLCAECGANLNEAGPEHAHEPEPDPRFSKLKELRFD